MVAIVVDSGAGCAVFARAGASVARARRAWSVPTCGALHALLRPALWRPAFLRLTFQRLTFLRLNGLRPVLLPLLLLLPEHASPAPAATAAATSRGMSQAEVYELLQAELLLRRGDSDAGFRKYLALSRSTRDPGVIAFAVKVGSYLDRREVTELVQLWVQVEPAAVEPHRLLAQRLQAAGQWKPALDAWVRVRQLGGNDRLDGWLALAEGVESTVVPTPLSALRAWRRSRPGDGELLRIEALLLLRQGRIADGLAVLAAHPTQTPEILETRVAAHLDLGDIAGARAVIGMATERGIDTREWRYEVALELLRAMRLEDARFELEGLIAGGWEQPDVLLALAYVALRQGDSTRARAVIARTPETPETRDLRSLYAGQTSELDRRLPEALDWYLRVQPGEHFVSARARAASVLVRLGRLADARGDLAGLRANYPEDEIRYWLVEADVLKEARDAAAAVQLLTAALAQRPQEPDLLYGRAMAYVALGNLAAMEADLRTILRQDPDDPRALNALGFQLADRTRRYGEALALVQRALALTPENPEVIDSMGWVLHKLGRRGEALTTLQDAWRRSKDPVVAAHLGEVLWVTGQQAEARRIWQEGQRIERNNRVLQQVMEKFLGRRPPG